MAKRTPAQKRQDARLRAAARARKRGATKAEIRRIMSVGKKAKRKPTRKTRTRTRKSSTSRRSHGTAKFQSGYSTKTVRGKAINNVVPTCPACGAKRGQFHASTCVLAYRQNRVSPKKRTSNGRFRRMSVAEGRRVGRIAETRGQRFDTGRIGAYHAEPGVFHVYYTSGPEKGAGADIRARTREAAIKKFKEIARGPASRRHSHARGRRRSRS